MRRSGRFSTSQVNSGSSFFVPTDGDARSPQTDAVISRRNLLLGAAGVGGVAAVGIGGSYAIDFVSNQGGNVDSISVPEEAVTALDSFEEIDYSEHVSKISETEFPYGTLAWADCTSYAAILEPTEGSNPINRLRILNLKSSNVTTLLNGPQSEDDGFEIFEARCSDEGVAWIEVNVYTSVWRVFMGTLAGGELSNILQLDEADSAWITPSLAVVGNKVFWQVMPHRDGAASDAKNVLKVAAFGAEATEVLWSTDRPFTTPVTPVGDGVVITPRAEESRSYVQLVKLSAEDGKEVDRMTLPQSMTPSFTGYGPNGFAFAFDSIYNYGGGISNLGTYTPMTKAEPNTYNDKQWFRFPRTPTASPSWCNNWLVVKSSRAICGVDLEAGQYFLISLLSGVDNYGEYLVSSGNNNYAVGLSQVKKSGDTTGSAVVRVFEIK